MNGQLSMISVMKDGSQIAEFKNYDSTGNLLQVGELMNGRLHGKNTGYYPGGVTRFSYQFRDGKKYGENLRFFPNGKTETREVVTASGNEVKEENYSQAGLLISEKIFKAGKPSGKWIFYQENGKDPLVIEQYLDGKLHGVRTSFHRGGKKSLEETYQFNLITGPVRNYDEEGRIEWECEYKGSRMHGVYTGYYPSGKVRELGTYVANKKHGEWKEFNESGEITKTTLFRAGLVVEN